MRLPYNLNDMPNSLFPPVIIRRTARPLTAFMGFFVIVFLAACGSLSAETQAPPSVTPVPAPTATVEPEPTGSGAPELAGLEGWINSEPFTIAERTSAGGVVLIDFWTYTCVNCIRTFPFLRDWHEKYADAGLTILGVHTPEFDFEKDREGVLKAMERFGLEYPVAQDNDRFTWDAFENRAWPAKYLFNAEGELVYMHFGEGDYLESERAIRAALTDAGSDLSGIEAGTREDPPEDASAFHLTGELYLGYGKVYGLGGSISLAPIEYYAGPDRVVEYVDPGIHHFDKIYLQGPWLNEKDAIVHARATTGLEDYIYARVFARSVNVVVEHRGDAPIEVIVELDGKPVPADGAGPDIVYDESGRSILSIDESRLYRLLELPEFGEHELVLRSNSDLFAVNAFTFGNYLEGP